MSASSPSSSGDTDQNADRRRSRFDVAGPSTSRPRFSNVVWPEPFVEALATQLAIDAYLASGHLAAGRALANLFQVLRSNSPLHTLLLLHFNPSFFFS